MITYDGHLKKTLEQVCQHLCPSPLFVREGIYTMMSDMIGLADRLVHALRPVE